MNILYANVNRFITENKYQDINYMKSLSDCNLQKVVAFPFLIVELHGYGNIKELILILRLSECMQNILFVCLYLQGSCAVCIHIVLAIMFMNYLGLIRTN